MLVVEDLRPLRSMILKKNVAWSSTGVVKS